MFETGDGTFLRVAVSARKKKNRGPASIIFEHESIGTGEKSRSFSSGGNGSLVDQGSRGWTRRSLIERGPRDIITWVGSRACSVKGRACKRGNRMVGKSLE